MVSNLEIPIRLLIVDDDDANRNMMKAVFRVLPVVIDQAKNGETAIDLLEIEGWQPSSHDGRLPSLLVGAHLA